VKSSIKSIKLPGKVSPLDMRSELNSSNMFGVNLIEQQKLQVELSEGPNEAQSEHVSASDGNIL
jgi:hypothetical protein